MFQKKNDAKIHNDPHQNLKWSQNQCCWWALGALVWALGKPADTRLRGRTVHAGIRQVLPRQ